MLGKGRGGLYKASIKEERKSTQSIFCKLMNELLIFQMYKKNLRNYD